MAEKKKKQWVREAFGDHKKGSYHRYFGIPKKEKIPIKLVCKIRNSEVGEVVTNPTGVGKKQYKVTRMMKKRANFMCNILGRWRKKR
jgi:hypothetical protein